MSERFNSVRRKISCARTLITRRVRSLRAKRRKARWREAIPVQQSARDKQDKQSDGTQQGTGSRLRSIAVRVGRGGKCFVARGLLRNTRGTSSPRLAMTVLRTEQGPRSRLRSIAVRIGRGVRCFVAGGLLRNTRGTSSPRLAMTLQVESSFAYSFNCARPRWTRLRADCSLTSRMTPISSKDSSS